jgi:hypothetical protein
MIAPLKRSVMQHGNVGTTEDEAFRTLGRDHTLLLFVNSSQSKALDPMFSDGSLRRDPTADGEMGGFPHRTDRRAKAARGSFAQARQAFAHQAANIELGPGRRTGNRQQEKCKAIAMTQQMPVLQIRHADGKDWKVAATWPDGRFEELKGFKTESEANEWITHSLQAWLDEMDRGASQAGAAASEARAAERWAARHFAGTPPSASAEPRSAPDVHGPARRARMHWPGGPRPVAASPERVRFRRI